MILQLPKMLRIKCIRSCTVLMALLFSTSFTAQEVPKLISSDAKDPFDLTKFKGTLFFSAETSNGKRWLWSTNGTTTTIRSGTVTTSHPGSQPFGLTVFNNKLIFSSVLHEGGNWNRELFGYAGIVEGAGPSLIKNIQSGGESSPGLFTEFNGNLYFSANDGVNGKELWVSDGTEIGTQLLKDIDTGSDNSKPNGFFEFDGRLLFIAKDEIHGFELWVTDGTENGTQLLKDINPDSFASYPRYFTVLNNKVYFQAEDEANGIELWVSDGTSAGTHILKDINSNLDDSSYPFGLIVFNDKIYFRANNGVDGVELWVTDGSENGTVLLRDINPGTENSAPSMFEIYKDKLYFGATDDNGVGLYVSDGTEAGTIMVKPTDNDPRSLFIYDNRLYFVAGDGINGRQVWVSDGTASGTEVVAPDEISNYNPISASDFEHVIVEGTLYYTADYDGNGYKLWKLTTNNLSVVDNTKKEFVAYPNPVKDILHLQTQTSHIKKSIFFPLPVKP